MILYVNACVRGESRTDRIARALLQTLGNKYEEVKLAEQTPEPLSEERLQKRTELIKAEMLDVDGFHAEEMVKQTVKKISVSFTNRKRKAFREV